MTAKNAAVYAVLLICAGFSYLNAQALNLTFPENLAEDIDPLSIGFEWTEIDTAIAYQIVINGEQDFNDPLINETPNNNTIVITELFPNWKFFWKVRAIFERDSSEWTSINEFRTQYNPAQNFSPAAEEVLEDTTSVLLMWQMDLNAYLDSIEHNYRVQVSADEMYENVVADFDLMDTNSVLVSDLIPNNTYFWRVLYSNIHGTSPWSTSTQFTTKNVPPGQPQLLIPEDNETGIFPINVYFEWDNVPGATSYNFEIALDSLFNSILESSSINSSSYSTNILAHNTRVFWRVQALNDENQEGAWSPVWRLTTSEAAPQSPPGLISPFDNIRIEVSDSVLFIWNPVFAATQYNLNISRDNIFTETDSNYFFTDTASFIRLDSQLDDRFFWRVRAVNSVDNGPWSDVFTFLVSEAPHMAPLLTLPSDSIILNNPDTISFAWQQVLLADQYELEISFDEAFNDLFSAMSYNDTSISVVLGELSAGQFYWRVRAINSIGGGPWSAVATFIINIETTIKNLSLMETGFELQQNYPNPFNPSTTIEFNLPERGLVQISVYNILGRLINELFYDYKNIGSYSVNWDGTNSAGVQTASGIYIYAMRVKTIAGKK